VSTTNNGRDNFRIEYSHRVAKEIEKLGKRAISKGLWQQFFQAWGVISVSLRSAPEKFGDPLLDLPSMKLRVFHRIVFPVSLVFCVDAVRKLVYIKSVHPFPPDTY